jgi:hypothetical protein
MKATIIIRRVRLITYSYRWYLRDPETCGMEAVEASARRRTENGLESQRPLLVPLGRTLNCPRMNELSEVIHPALVGRRLNGPEVATNP